MDVNRRQFIQISSATAAGLAVGGLGLTWHRSKPMPAC